MNIIEDLIPINTHNKRRCGIKREVKGITIHNTANPKSTAKNERGWLINTSNNRQADYNYAVDDKEIILAIPEDEVTWNAGDGRNGFGNVNTISMELCESGNFEKTKENAINLIVKLMIKYDLGIKDIYKHQDHSGKYCPRLLIPIWDEFIKQVSIKYFIEYAKINKEDNFEDNVKTLNEIGIINTPNYWLSNDNYNPEYVKFLINRLANYVRQGK